MKLEVATWYLGRYDLVVLILGSGIYRLYWIAKNGEIKATAMLSEHVSMLEVLQGKNPPDIFWGKSVGSLLFSFRRAVSMPAVIGRNFNKILQKAMQKLSTDS